jgi:hypothetical protein
LKNQKKKDIIFISSVLIVEHNLIEENRDIISIHSFQHQEANERINYAKG